MDSNLISQAIKIDDMTMAIPQSVPEPMTITLDQINARIADRQIAMQGLQDANTIDQELLAKANEIGLKTTEELAAVENTDLAPEDNG